MCSQDRSEVLQKNYSSGVRFLTVFPDGSAQVLYPLMMTCGLDSSLTLQESLESSHVEIEAAVNKWTLE